MNIKAVIIFFVLLSWCGTARPGDRESYIHLSDSLAAVFEESSEKHSFDTARTSLDYYLAYAASQNPALRAAFYQWRAHLEKAGYAGALPEPTISYSHFIETVETRVGPQERRLSLRQAVPWFGTLGARRDAALAGANSAYQRFQSEKFKLFYEVKAAYFEYYYIGRDLSITRGNLELLKFWEAVARAKYRVALKQHPDIIKVQVELGILEDRVRTIEGLMGPIAARLRAALNLSDHIDLPVPGDITIEGLELNRELVKSKVITNNPDLKSFIHLIDKEKAGVSLAGKLTRPRFIFGIDYIQTGDAINPSVIDNGKDPWIVTVGFSLPIWLGANKARKKEAEANHRKAEYDYADAQNQLRAFTDKVIFDYNDALRKVRLYRDGLLPKAEQSLNANYTAYQAGETDFLNLLDSQRQLLDFQLQFERSKSSLATHLARIEMLMGDEYFSLEQSKE